MRTVSLFSAAIGTGLATAVWALPELPFFGVPSTTSFKTFKAGSQPVGRLRDGLDPALRFISEQTKVPVNQIKITRDYKSNGARFVFVQRVIDSVPVVNNIAHTVIQDNSIVAFSSTFSTAAPEERMGNMAQETSDAAVAAAVQAYGIPRNSWPVKRSSADQGNTVVSTWQFELQSNDHWLDIHARVNDSVVISAIDWVHNYTYTAANFRDVNPTGPGGKGVYSPSVTSLAKYWHDDKTNTYSDTRGNNAKLYTTYGGTQAYIKANDNGNFNYPYEFGLSASEPKNKNASAVSLFYLVNQMHDLASLYGFDEASGNFQTTNYGGEGEGDDAVVVSSQDPGGMNNANMATPPEGRAPRMNMYLFTPKNAPLTDGGYESDIPIHEFTHGISNRLTGGSDNGWCLSQNEGRGMGEGWSDALGLMIASKENQTGADPVAIGSWVLGIPTIRGKMYSTDMKVNDYTLGSIRFLREVHAIGEVWATIWYELLWAMREVNGFSDNIWDPTQDKGNIHALHLFMTSLKMQPCNPTFLTGRDAIIAAEQVLYKGKYHCALWKAFAKRGLGVSSTTLLTFPLQSSKVPEECR